jgi:hypothetical protein
VFGGGARLGERGWGADAHAAEAALCVVRGVDQRPRLGLGDPQFLHEGGLVGEEGFRATDQNVSRMMVAVPQSCRCREYTPARTCV